MVREAREKKVSVINMGWEEENTGWEENRTTVLKTQADFQSLGLQQRERGRERGRSHSSELSSLDLPNDVLQ